MPIGAHRSLPMSTLCLGGEAQRLSRSYCLCEKEDSNTCTHVLQFVDSGRKALEAAEAGSDQPGAQLPKDQGSARSLRTFLESFITEEFLPEVYVTFR